MDETIATISCGEMSEKEFEQKFVRKRIPVKLVGCAGNSDLSKFSVESLLHKFEALGTSFEAKFLSGNETLREEIGAKSLSKLLSENVIVDAKVANF
jgi:superfamily I DNA/RNA helicase